MVNSQLFFTFDSKTSLSKTDIVVGSFNKTVVEFLFYNNRSKGLKENPGMGYFKLFSLLQTDFF